MGRARGVDDGVTLVDRYILRQLVGAFVIVTGVLTVVLWLTTALRQIELVASQGQTLWIFVRITSLALPLLVMHLAPFALFIALVFTLNKLNGDSELVVLSASGVSHGRLLRPVLMMAAGVAGLLLVLALYAVPATLREMRQAFVDVKLDLIGNIAQPGRFTSLEPGLTFHIKERQPNGSMLGIFVDDKRDPAVHMTYLAARGSVERTPIGTFLVMEEGEIVRRNNANEQQSVISFDRYGFNLSSFVSTFRFSEFPPAERWTGELTALMERPDVDPRLRGRLRSEFHDRFAAPLYPIAFALFAFAALGRARTTRQSRNEGVVLAIVAVVGLRVAGFGVSGLAQREPAASVLIYLIPLAGIGAGLLASLGTRRLPFRGGARAAPLVADPGPVRP